MSWALDVINPAGARVGASLDAWPKLKTQGFRLPELRVSTGRPDDPVMLDLSGCGLGDCLSALPAAQHLANGGGGSRQLWVLCPSKMAFAFAPLDCRVLTSAPDGFLGLRLDGLAALQQTMLAGFAGFNPVEALCALADCKPAVPALVPNLSLVSHAERLIAAKAPDRQIIIVQPRSASACKDWPLDCWLDLAERLEAAGGRAFSSDGPSGHLQPLSSLPPSVEELAAQIAVADLVVAPDSLGLHLAAAVGTPCIGLFGPTLGKAMCRWYPLARALQSPTSLGTGSAASGACPPGLTGLTVSAVEAACLEELGDG